MEHLRLDTPATYLAVVALIAGLCQLLAWNLRVPSILVLLTAGFALGQWVSPDQVLGQDVLFGVVGLTVGVILFEGALTLKFDQIKDLGTTVRRLCTVTVALAWPLITLAAWQVGFDARLALLIGALLVVTGPTVIAPIVRQLRPTRRAASLLRWEGIVVDPIGAVLAMLVYQGIVARGESKVTAVLAALGLTLALGFGIALAAGWLLRQALLRHVIPDFLQPVILLGTAVAAFAASNLLRSESGLLTVTVLGLYLANQKDLNLSRVREFKEHLQVLLVGGLFVLLAGRVSVAELTRVAPQALAFVAILILIARPVSILVSLAGTEATVRERTLLAFMAPRGIVAAAVTSIFARELGRHAAKHPGEGIQALALQAQDLVPTVFLVVVVTVTVYGLGVGLLAERLGLASSSPQGVLFAGASPWVVQAASRLQELGVSTLLVSRDFAGVWRCRRAGLAVQHTHVLSDYAVEEMDLTGLGYLIAVTPHDQTNATAAREYAHTFGSSNTFQLHRAEHVTGAAPKRKTSEKLTGRTCFSPPVTFAQIDDRVRDGATVESRFASRGSFREQHGDDAVAMFAVRDGKVSVITTDDDLPARGAHVVALVSPEKGD